MTRKLVHIYIWWWCLLRKVGAPCLFKFEICENLADKPKNTCYFYLFQKKKKVMKALIIFNAQLENQKLRSNHNIQNLIQASICM